MGKHVALLRGINVGRAKRVAMTELRALTESLGYRDVRTLLNSGNIIFQSSEPPRRAASRIEAGLLDRVGVASRVIVLTAADVSTIASENTLADATVNPSRLLVAVVSDPRDLPLLLPLTGQQWGSDALVIGSRAAYIYCPDSTLASKLLEAVAKLLGDGVTTRNWATFTKIRTLLE